MAKFELNCYDGKLYLKDEIKKLLNVQRKKEKITGLANAMTVVLLSKGATLEEALQSIDVLRQDLKLRIRRGIDN